ncbi:hypothetical protein J4573_21720 [Actinomadura barringtoniae]|uniref:Uncharacterized protein n=1 Tax=Actinomadura barringtoniae TaxID=1427535 RepID=A0A939T2J3_9ACTN|nr:hypothetical protein [Actinomadura barringtoniae]MBO2449736.1 hypothetical protein [Actinomadura barringtoniae]
MSTPREINRRMNRQENEVVDIHDALKEIRDTQKKQTEQFEARFTQMDAKFEAGFARLDEKIDAKFDLVVGLLTKGGEG